MHRTIKTKKVDHIRDGEEVTGGPSPDGPAERSAFWGNWSFNVGSPTKFPPRSSSDSLIHSSFVLLGESFTERGERVKHHPRVD